ncbi:MAG: T9SS type B sorting domain-containing protein [Flavobacterium sp.]|nr:T9SS type B sorting domain-containing protein [Flavobacterium sp.]
MKKFIFFLFMLFSINYLSSQTISEVSRTCTSINFRYNHSTVPNGNWRILVNSNIHDTSNSGVSAVCYPISFSGGIGLFSVPLNNITQYDNTLRIASATVYNSSSACGVGSVHSTFINDFFFFNNDPQPNTFAQDLMFMPEYPVNYTKISTGGFGGTYTICQKDFKEIFLDRFSYSSSGYNGTYGTSLFQYNIHGNINGTNKLYQATIGIYSGYGATATLVYSFTDIVDNTNSSNPVDGFDIPTSANIPPGDYFIAIMAFNELDYYTLSPVTNQDCRSNSTALGTNYAGLSNNLGYSIVLEGSTFNRVIVVADIDAPTGTPSVLVSEPLCLGNDGIVTLDVSGISDGTYDIAYTLTGVNTSSQVATGVVISSGTGTFSIPSTVLSNSGNTIIEINSIINPANCSYDFSTGELTDSFIVGFSPDILGTTNTIDVLNICQGNNGNATFNSSSLTDGNYIINYTLTGNNTGNFSVNVVVSSGTGTFSIPSAVLSNLGTTTIEITSVSDEFNSCTSSYTSGNVTDSFNVNYFPNISGTNNVLVSEPLCLGSDGTVTFNSSTLANGNYIIDYNITGTNNSLGNSINVVISSGTGMFSIPSVMLSNSGLTNIEILTISTPEFCFTNFSSGSVTDSFTVGTLPNLSGTNNVVVSEPLCLGTNGAVTFNSSTLANGNYNIAYTLTGANASNQVANSVVFNSGTGTFSIPSAVLSNSGATTISINTVSSSSTSCATVVSSGNVTDSFTVEMLPNLEGELTQIFCHTEIVTIADLVLNYQFINWYDSVNSTISLPITTILENGVSYFAEAYNANGCTSSERLEINVVIQRCDFLIPDGFSPNNDGVNDIYNIVNGNIYYPNYSIEVYDRYGSKITQGKNWDGKLNGNILPAGIYYLIMYYNDATKEPTQHFIFLNK